MPSKLSKHKQSIFDIASENFGTLDNLIKLSNDNSISISDNLLTNTLLNVNSEGLGEADIKTEISDSGFTFNNDYIALALLTADTTEYTADTTEITADIR
jgi:hypothetical protein